MTSGHTAMDAQIRIARSYFARVDAGDGTLLDMFTDDVQAFFPKIGITRGTAELLNLVQTLTRVVRQCVHDPSRMLFTHQGTRLVVEGVEAGEFADGAPFPAGAKSEGRFCNVFEFRDGLISRLNIYADPDYAGQYDSPFSTSAQRLPIETRPSVEIARENFMTAMNVADTTPTGDGPWHANSKTRSPSSLAEPPASDSPRQSASSKKARGCM